MDTKLWGAFELLGLKPSATREEVRQARRDLVQVWHPDRFAGNPRLQERAEETLKQINEAVSYIFDSMDAGWIYFSGQEREEEFNADYVWESNEDDFDLDEPTQSESETSPGWSYFEEGTEREMSPAPPRRTFHFLPFLKVSGFAALILVFAVGAPLLADYAQHNAPKPRNEPTSTNSGSVDWDKVIDQAQSIQSNYTAEAASGSSVDTTKGDWFVIVGSFGMDRRDLAFKMLERVQYNGYNGHVLWTSPYPDLTPSLMAVVIGPNSESLVRARLEQLQDDYKGAYIKRIPDAKFEEEGAVTASEPGLPPYSSSLALSDDDSNYGVQGRSKVKARIHADADKSSKVLYRVLADVNLRVGYLNNLTWIQVALPDGERGYMLRKQVEATGAESFTLNDPPPYQAPPLRVTPREIGPPIVEPYRRIPSGGGYGLYYDTGGGHWIKSVSDGGAIIVLEDQSVWQVDSVDRVDSALWLATEDIIVHESSSSIGGYVLINTDNGEKVGAKYLGK